MSTRPRVWCDRCEALGLVGTPFPPACAACDVLTAEWEEMHLPISQSLRARQGI